MDQSFLTGGGGVGLILTDLNKSYDKMIQNFEKVGLDSIQIMPDIFLPFSDIPCL